MQFAFLCRPLPGRVQVANPFGCIYECNTTIYVEPMRFQVRTGLRLKRDLRQGPKKILRNCEDACHNSARYCNKNPSKICPKSTQNERKIFKNQGLEGSGGPLGEVWEPCWPPGEPRSSKVSENHIRGSRWDPPLGHHFRHFFRFLGVFAAHFF